MTEASTITTLEALAACYGASPETSLLKEVPFLHPHYQTLIKASPFCILATAGKAGLDVSPRGDAPGFVEIVDEKTLILPDRRGNNRIDSLKNILENPQVSLIFLIPGIGETLRVNGTAVISKAPDVLARHAVNGKEPTTVLIITVDTVFFQCSKALTRSHLWDASRQIPRSALPSTGTILADISKAAIDGTAYDAALPERLKQTLY